MNFYTLNGAMEYAKKRGKGTMFWIPCRYNNPILNGAPHLWVCDPSGRKKNCYKATHAIRIWIDKHGIPGWHNGPLTVPEISQFLKWEYSGNRFVIAFDDLTVHAQDRYLRFRGALNKRWFKIEDTAIAIVEAK